MTNEPFDQSEEPPLTRPSSPSEGQSKRLFNLPEAARFAVAVRIEREGWYTLKHAGAAGTMYMLWQSADAINTAAADMTNGIPMPVDSVGIVFYVANTDKFTVWRSALTDNASLTYWGRKKPDFIPWSNKMGEYDNMILILEDGVLVGTLPPNTGINFLTPLMATENSPNKDIGVDIPTLLSMLGEPEFLWHQVGYDIHADHFGGANGIHPDSGSGISPTFQYASFIMNDYWKVSQNMVLVAEE
jgi:hypothetical protein